MRPGGDRGAGDAIVLRLERADGVDDEIGAKRGEGGGEVIRDIERDTLGIGERRRERLGLRARATRDQQPDRRVAREAVCDRPAEIAVAAEDEDARGDDGPLRYGFYTYSALD
ncbi:MAG: hypothetical protein WDN44_00345 [Sphingomonas sp.]